MELKDNELGALEQLTYLNQEVAHKAGREDFSGIKEKHEGKTIEQILECFDENALRRLEEKDDEAIGFVSAKEWAGIIRYLKTSRMKDLVLIDRMENENEITLGLCFAESGESDEAIVAFRGTAGKAEWVDNVEGFNCSDTRYQKEALDFIEGLPYEEITVTGHSKGGNKAMYVAITSGKVARCVVYDGQGFSPEFLGKYWAEIQMKGEIITAYSLSTDYVHALLFPIPNSEQKYCKGYGVANIGEHHSPNSFFKTDKDGRIIVDNNGNPIVVEIPEDESIVMLHEFTTFILNNANEQDKKLMVGFLSELLAMVFASGFEQQEVIDYCLREQDTLAMIIAYLAKYMEVNDVSSEEIDQLLTVLGLEPLDELLMIEVFGVEIIGLSGLIDLVKENLTDNDDDWILKNGLLPLGNVILLSNLDLDISAFWEKINSKVRQIDASKGWDDAKVRTGSIRDFSLNTYGALLNNIDRIKSIGKTSVSGWGSYSGEEWYSPLLIDVATYGINAYFTRLAETSEQCKVRVELVFNHVENIDNTFAGRILDRSQELQDIRASFVSIAEKIG